MNYNLEDFDPKKYLKPGLTEKDIIQIREVFEFFDGDRDGKINPSNMRNAMLK